MTYEDNKIPLDLRVDIETLHERIWAVINKYCDDSGIDLNNYKIRSTVKHNTVLNMLTHIYNNIYKPDRSLINDQKSNICYNNLDELAAACYEFIEVCSYFNVAHGMYAFQIMTGIDDNTLLEWEAQSATESNRKRSEIIKAVRDYNKNALLGLLKDSGVGAIAVANNDIETGLEWAKNNQQITQNNTVVYLPSERLDRLRLGQNPENP